MDGPGNQLFTRTGFAQDQHRAVALRHHLNLLEHAVHGVAAPDDFTKLAVHVVELFGQGQVLIHQPLFQAVDLLIGEGVIQRDGDTLGDLAQQLQVGGGKHGFITLRQLQHPQHGVAGHQGKQAQGLNLVAPGVKQHPLIRCHRVLLAQVEQQDLFALKHPLRQGARFVHFALLVRRVGFIQIMRGVDVQLALAMAAQRDADGIDFEIVVDLFRHFADQLVHIKARQHGVGDGDQNAEVVALAAQQVVIHVIGHAALDLLRDDGHNLGKGVQTLVFRLAPGLVGRANKLAATKNMSLRRERQHAVVAERLVEVALREPRPRRAELLKVAVQRFRTGENTAHRAMREIRFVFVLKRFAIIAR